MGINQFPASAGGLSSVVKSVQRGVASSSGSITISSVDTTKTQVNSFSTGASGSTAINGNVYVKWGSGQYSPVNQNPGFYVTNVHRYGPDGYGISGMNQVISGGTSDVTAASFGAYLSNSTTLVVTGACRYEVVEYN
jgi:hypothetical protein